jgi:hypothetical protein
MNDGASHIEDNVIGAAGQPHQSVMLRAWHDEALYTLDRFVETFEAGRGVVGKEITPQFGPKPDYKVHACCGGSRLTDRGDRRGEFFALLRVQEVKLKVRVRGGPEREDSSLRRVHAGIISVHYAGQCKLVHITSQL